MQPSAVIDRLDALNQSRFSLGEPMPEWRTALRRRHELEFEEIGWLESRRERVAGRAAAAPTSAPDFIRWFEELESSGPGQGDPLFDWLAQEATADQMRWFLLQEVAGEAGFEDLVALSQLKLPARPKLEMARNYWDEMGRGAERGMHGPMLHELAKEMDLATLAKSEPVLAPARELGQVMSGLAHHRMYALQSIGALGAIELTAPGRAGKVYQGLKRLGVSPAGTRYFLLHSTLDVKHSASWNTEVLGPLVEADPRHAAGLAEGALMRLEAGAACFAAYRSRFGL